MELFFSSNSGEDQKKVFTKNGTLFSSNLSGDLRSDADHSQIIGGKQMLTTLELLGDTVKLLGGYIPLGFGTPG